jgi:hypothetical protein
VQVVASDLRGQRHASRALTVQVDARPPSVAVHVTGPRRAGAPLRIGATARDRGGSGLRGVRVDYGDGARASRRSSSVHRYRRGSYALTVRATDRAGNVTSRTVRLRIA